MYSKKTSRFFVTFYLQFNLTKDRSFFQMLIKLAELNMLQDIKNRPILM